jgi:hypothetical protein
MAATLTTFELPQPRLRHVYRLEAQLGPPVDVGLTPLGEPDELERLAHGEYTFGTTMRIETSDSSLAWMNNCVSISVGGRRTSGVAYDVYRLD